MASEDVIELGSSDDDTEPVAKKSKPTPNAMVCIPRNIHEVTIKPAKLNISMANKGINRGMGSKEVAISKGVPISKGLSILKGVPVLKGVTPPKPSSLVTNPFACKTKSNGKPVHKNIVRPQVKLAKPITIQKSLNSNTMFTKISCPTNISNAATTMNTPIRIANAKSLTNLPPSITVKRTTQLIKKPIIFMNATAKNKVTSKQAVEVPTVELDDDESSPPNSSPAWYLRPEEQTASLEQENNKEPEPPTMIEITIEDSPIKPVPSKRTCEVGAELAITVDDSPVKQNTDKNACSESDDETGTSNIPHSKKKLKYPKEDDQSRKTVEIEIDIPHEISVDNSATIEKSNVSQNVTIVAVEHSPVPCTEKKTSPTALKERNVETPSSNTKSEFHSVYQSFIDLCFQLENSDDMTKIVEKKIKAYYRQVPKEYTESEEFIDMVASKVLAMKSSPDKMYLYIKDIVDELNMQRKFAKSQVVNHETKTEEPDRTEQFIFGEENEYDVKRQRQIHKLEKTIKKLHRAIQKLEEQEIDFDDEDDSVYILTERYKERMVRVYAKFCQLTNTKMPSEPRIVLDVRPGQPSGPAKRLEKWINKKVPIGTPLPFPDFHDVLRCVREANDEDKLLWNEADIMEEARDLFMRCGKKLQRRRQENEWRLAASRIALDVDPAEKDEQLKGKLDENKKLATNRETEIFNKYADRQNQLKLEAVEIGDKEAEESPVESEEEEANDENVALENKKKRKDRLKRLLQEKSQKASEGKEKQQSKESKEGDDDTTETKMIEEKITTKEPEPKEDSKEINEDSSKISEKAQNNNENSHDAAETLSVSDDSDLESDIDELHLLQKLHSGNEAQTSTQESSDFDSPIAISDSLESGSDSKKELSDVISIENSSYSESEADKNVDNAQFENTAGNELVVRDKIPNNEPNTRSVVHAGMEAESVNTTMNVECSSSGNGKVHIKSNNDEYTDPVENILLASSDDEQHNIQEDSPPSADSACINLRDDVISIDETVVGNVHEPHKDIDTEPTVIISDKELNRDKQIEGEINANDVDLIDDNKVKEKNLECKHTSQNEALSALKEKAADNVVNVLSEDIKSADTVISMDVDQDETVPLTLSSETQ